MFLEPFEQDAQPTVKNKDRQREQSRNSSCEWYLPSSASELRHWLGQGSTSSLSTLPSPTLRERSSPQSSRISYRGLPGGSELKMMSSASFLEPLSTPATAYHHPPSLHSAFTWFFGQMERQNRSSPHRPSGCSEVGGAGALCSSQGDEEEAPGHPALWGVTRPPGSRVARRRGWDSSEMK